MFVDLETFELAMSTMSKWKRLKNMERDKVICRSIFINQERQVDVAKAHNLSPERIRQISRRAYRLMKRIKSSR